MKREIADNREYFVKQNDIFPANDYFCTTKQKMAYPTQPNPIRFSPYPLLLYRNKSLMYA